MSYADTRPLPDPHYDAAFYSGVPAKRLLAWVVDTVVIIALSLLIVPFTAFTGLFFFPLLMLVTGFFYRWATIAGGSATWGMRLMAIEFRRGDGARFDGSTAFLHTLGYSLSWAFPLAQLASVVLMVITERKQGLTDHVLETVAINRAG
ncbi:hypothetical protein ATO6_09910 [Oceanicola sp. 22II-s10i]|uniref:RDD family protein n=1 Tax=Oceanicola sp. 22II-s10i TaxID=1317116 RepID=UPI000B524215|nr:RDD family protein [Oceanicola sp. 22II-s10i]OWU85321.1 hypothetical protein ATO6_09910 [Oceanicola sp. 22II-s10i]